jgi:hypothetical protein
MLHQNNTYVQQFKQTFDIPAADAPEYELIIRTDGNMDRRRYNAPTTGEIAAGISEAILNQALLDIQEHLRTLGGPGLAERGLPVPTPVHATGTIPTLVAKELEKYDAAAMAAKVATNVPLLNTEQRLAYESVCNAIALPTPPPTGNVFFLDGPGGCGKTFLYNTLLAFARSQGKVAIAVASSGIAALLLDGGRTAHSRFKIPVKGLDANSTCNITAQSELAELLKFTGLIVWDEAAMMHKHALEAVDKTLRDIMATVNPAYRDIPFGGKVVVLGGDFRQVLPVVVRGSRGEVVNACLKRSASWGIVQPLALIVNMRVQLNLQNGLPATELQAFADYLKRLGDGTDRTYPEHGEDMVAIPDDMCCQTEDVNDLITAIYGDLATISDPSTRQAYIVERAILTPKNVDVDVINDTMMATFNQDSPQEHVYLSADCVAEADQRGTWPVEFLNSLMPSGVPPHTLRLKVGCPIMLLRNMTGGLANGTRLICKRFMPHLIDAEVVTGPDAGQRVFIPRLSITPSDTDKMPFTMCRRQFPVRAAFAMTINKAQGQTMAQVGIYLPQPVFSHGQLYVAASRVGRRQAAKVMVVGGRKLCADGVERVVTKNVVYAEVL